MLQTQSLLALGGHNRLYTAHGANFCVCLEWVMVGCAGALLAVGILNCGLQHENDPAYALLHDFVDKQDPVVRIGAIMGLGLAYAGTQKEEVCPPEDAIQAHHSVCTCQLRS